MCLSRSRDGFTLVEVLVASIILFATITIGTVAYRTTVAQAKRTASVVLLCAAVPDIVEDIRTKIPSETEGKGSYSKYIIYEWTAKSVRTGNTVEGPFDMETGALDMGSYTLTLYEVQLQASYVRPPFTSTQSFTFTELTWMN